MANCDYSLILSSRYLLCSFSFNSPFFNESQVEFAGAFASSDWIIAHTFGMEGFLFLSLGVLGIYFLLLKTKVEPLAFWTLVLTWIGTGLTQSFFGAETFSLPVIGQGVLQKKMIHFCIL